MFNTGKAYRKYYSFLQGFKEFFSEHKNRLIIQTILFLFLIFTGLFTALRYSGNASTDIFFDKILIILADGEANFWSIFFSRLLFSIFAICLFYLTNISKYTVWITYVFIGYFAYKIGLDIGIIIISLNFAGIVFGFCLYLILIIAMAITFFLLNSMCYEFHKCGNTNSRKHLNSILVVTICLLFTIIIQSIVFPLCSSIFIFN